MVLRQSQIQLVPVGKAHNQTPILGGALLETGDYNTESALNRLT